MAGRQARASGEKVKSVDRGESYRWWPERHLVKVDWRGIGDSLYDHLGNGFTLLRLGPKPTDGAALVAAAKEAGVPLDVIDVADVATRDLYGADLALIRPDQHVAWRGSNSPSDPSTVLARVIGA
jgi:hypothetical protein